jgi:hypothetical protein
MAKEYRRTCKRCGMVWHSLVSREAKVKRNVTCGNCDTTSSIGCCAPNATEMQAKRNVQTSESELHRLRQCPKCQSSSYKEEIVRG